MKDSGWRFDEINSMTIYFYETCETNGRSYVRIPLRPSAFLNTENDNKYCFLWPILAYIHPCNINHPNRVSNYRQYFNELNIQDLDFTNGFKCNDVHIFEKLKNLSINIFELNFYQDQNKWRHKLIPIEVSRNESDRVIDLIFYKNHYALIKILNVSSGDRHKNFICRRCLNSYTSEKMIMIQKPKFKYFCITTTRTSLESHIHWKDLFHKNPLHFGIYADFEADNEIDNSSIGNKTSKIYKQNPVCKGYKIVSELDDFLKSGPFKSPLGYENDDWFVVEL